MLESTTTKTIMTIDTQEVGQARRHQVLVVMRTRLIHHTRRTLTKEVPR